MRIVFADFAAIHAIGKSLVPAEGKLPPIRMKRECVDIHVYQHVAVVEADFEFESLSDEDVDVEVGFPCFLGTLFPGVADPMIELKVTANGEEVGGVRQGLDVPEYPMWYVWQQRFPARAITRLRAEYKIPPEPYRSPSRKPITYVLRTGRFWQGTIGEATVKVHLRGVPPWSLCEASPGGWSLSPDGRTLSWHFTDFVPESDIAVLLSPLAIEAAFDGIRLDDVQEVVRNPPDSDVRVVVGGACIGDTYDSKDLKRLLKGFVLSGERYHDGNMGLPAGFSHLRKDATCLRVAPSNASVSEYLPNSPQFALTQSYLVRGVIKRDCGIPILHPEHILVAVRHMRGLSGQPILQSKSGPCFTTEPPSNRHADLTDSAQFMRASQIFRGAEVFDGSRWQGISLDREYSDKGVEREREELIVDHSIMDRERERKWPDFKSFPPDSLREEKRWKPTTRPDAATPPVGDLAQPSQAALPKYPLFFLAQVVGNSMAPMFNSGDVLLAGRVLRARAGHCVIRNVDGVPTLCSVDDSRRTSKQRRLLHDSSHNVWFCEEDAMARVHSKAPEWLIRLWGSPPFRI